MLKKNYRKLKWKLDITFDIKTLNFNIVLIIRSILKSDDEKNQNIFKNCLFCCKRLKLKFLFLYISLKLCLGSFNCWNDLSNFCPRSESWPVFHMFWSVNNDTLRPTRVEGVTYFDLKENAKVIVESVIRTIFFSGFDHDGCANGATRSVLRACSTTWFCQHTITVSIMSCSHYCLSIRTSVYGYAQARSKQIVLSPSIIDLVGQSEEESSIVTVAGFYSSRISRVIYQYHYQLTVAASITW